MRAWRVDHPPTPEQRRRSSVRAYANVYKRRGKLKPAPCLICGATGTQMHHRNYDQPLDVIWVCEKHHRYFTRLQRRGLRY